MTAIEENEIFQVAAKAAIAKYGVGTEMLMVIAVPLREGVFHINVTASQGRAQDIVEAAAKTIAGEPPSTKCVGN